jgi:hypothetical protein
MSYKSDRTTRAGLVAFVVIAATVSIPARAQEQVPNVTGTADGGCVYHKNVGGAREDINIANGATYHQAEMKGKKSGVIYVPERMWLCKDGHFSRAE